jgi:hypothetical protein
MDTANLTADLVVGNLTPASAVRAVDGHSAHQETAGRAPRRRRTEAGMGEAEMESENLDVSIPTSGDNPPAHQVDDVA